MLSRRSFSRNLYTSFEAGVAACLCALLLAQPLPAVAARKKTASQVLSMQDDEHVLHALNRFTFGPRPGDVAAVKAMGLDRWFDQQLHPEKIDDSALEERLANYPAMNLKQADLLRRYPSPQILRQVMNGRLSMPGDPVEAAIYRDGIARYEEAKAKDAKKPVEMANNAAPESMAKSKDDEVSALPGDNVDPGTPAMAEHEKEFYSGLDAINVVNLPPGQRMKRILAMNPDELRAFRKHLNPGELAAAGEGLTPEQKEVLMALGTGGPRLVGGEILATRFLRDAYSQRQLQAVMTDFWLNHFNVYIRKNQNEPYLLPSYERDTIRPHALGKFEDLLVATAKSPAMLLYLDNAQSIGPHSRAAERVARVQEMTPNAPAAKGRSQGLNENYARELMELHTLGVNGGYNQADVVQVAKVFTGWTVEPLRGGEFQFEERRHEPGTKTVMGKAIREGGEREGLEVLHMLATSPATARFLSNKLAVRFVSDTPPQSLVDKMSKAYLVSDGDIATVLRTMFEAPEFWSPQVVRAKMKTPVEFVVSAVRASNTEIANPLPLVRALDTLGMPLYGMQTPNGYNWMAEPWVSTGALVSRMNFAVALSANRLQGSYSDWSSLLATKTPNLQTVAADDATVAKEAELEALLLGQPASGKTRETVLKQLSEQPAQMEAEKAFRIASRDKDPMGVILNASAPVQPVRPRQDRETVVMAGLLLGSPEFQRR
ncbi:MAG: DUF1800 domain-containing protein [Acidobacteria bacterium]|nr:DUF1800 domain-containing protein [Acidobacteriota bacterium]